MFPIYWAHFFYANNNSTQPKFFLEYCSIFNDNYAYIHLTIRESTFLKYISLSAGKEIISNISKNAYGAITFSIFVLSFIVISFTVSILSVRWL